MDSMVIYPTNRQCATHNQECVRELSKTTNITNIVASDRFSNETFNTTTPSTGGIVYEKMSKKAQDYTSDDVNKTAGLPSSLSVGTGARVMVRVNIDTLDKIVNGVTGTVHSIDLKPGKMIEAGTLIARDVRQINIVFDDVNVGRSIKHRCDKYCSKTCTKTGTVPIKPVEKEFLSKKNNKTWLKRYQVPLVLSWACTVHKVQGLTLSKAFIFLAAASKGHSWQSGMAYTASSRLTSLSGLHFISFDHKQIRTSQKVVAEYSRLRSVPPVTLHPQQDSKATSSQEIITSPIPFSPISLPCSPFSPRMKPSLIVLDELGRPHSPPSPFDDSPVPSRTLKRTVPFSPLSDSTCKQFRGDKLYSPLPSSFSNLTSKLKRSIPRSPSTFVSPTVRKHKKINHSQIVGDSPVAPPLHRQTIHDEFIPSS
ncbi:uncharacterized protein LOC134814319 [Bolinopsis microptera]|uniref:uncharacterized protein LOC134814319 n=1 Tax=Bolinopsis microptera TaxID=2820187 RepID=UPI003079E2EA